MNIKKGFSLSELMIIMLLVSIALAASIPIITKKHLKLPLSNIEHGVYICYYDDNGQLHEKRFANQFGISKPIFDRAVPEGKSCVFNPPKKAAYFQVSAVGGGGGGGDSGYTGGNLHTGWTDLSYFKSDTFNENGTVFGITEADIAGPQITKSEFENISGTVYGFAWGKDSGKGGDANYVEQDPHDSYRWKEPSGSTSGTVALKGGVFACGDECPPGKACWDNDGRKIEYTVTTKRPEVITPQTPTLECKDEPKTVKMCVCNNNCLAVTGDESFCRRRGSGWCQYSEKREDKYCCYDTKSGKDVYCTKDKINSDQCPTGANLACEVRGPESCTDSQINANRCPYVNIAVTKTSDCPNGEEKDTTQYEYVCKQGEPVTGESYLGGELKDHTETYSYTPLGKYCWNVSGEEALELIKFDAKQYEQNSYTEDDKIWIPGYKAKQRYDTGGKGGLGAACVTPKVNVVLGLDKDDSQDYDLPGWYNGNNTETTDLRGAKLQPYTGSVQDYLGGERTEANDGLAYCADGFSNDCGDNAKYSQFVITAPDGEGTQRYSVRAYSSPKGGTGGKRILTTAENSLEKARSIFKEDGVTPADVGYYNTPENGTDGTQGLCKTVNDEDIEPITKESVIESVCEYSKGELPTYGYCLTHNFNPYPGLGYNKIERSGTYRYRHSFDENYLQYGNPGDAGEYKSVIIRSFKDMDTTIRVGRGGAAGTKNSGASGSDGSPTYVGSIITAEGGKGGKGGIIGRNEQLPRYDASKIAQEDSCFHKEDYCRVIDDAGNVANPTECTAVTALESEIDEYNNLLTCERRYPDGYEYHIKTGQLPGGVPVLTGLSSNLFSYVLPRIVDDITALFNKAGHGGQGGGVTHDCWAGQWITDFDNSLDNNGDTYPYWFSNDVYPVYSGNRFRKPGETTATGYIPTSADVKKVPEGCYTNYTVTDATDGVDGAVMIKW